jgi:Ala-tRNA(Pro) deacylase
MSISQRLRDLLDHAGVKYTVVTHAPAYTAQEIAQSLNMPGREIAKVVVIKVDSRLALAVLPAQVRVDLERLGAALKAKVVIATEREFAEAFPDCELGAMPPFGALYGLRTWVDESLTHDREIVFNAGTHSEAIRMSFEDYRRLAAPILLWFAGEPARAGS